MLTWLVGQSLSKTTGKLCVLCDDKETDWYGVGHFVFLEEITDF